jgi:histidinol dehydrogenase
VTAAGLRRVAPSVINVARAEGFLGHAQSVLLRLPAPAKGKARARKGRRK